MLMSWEEPALWRETSRPPIRPCGRRERARLLSKALALEWVRLNPMRREIAENIVRWAGEHLDNPKQRDWLVTAWRRNRARGLLRDERRNDDIGRSFGKDLRRARKWCAEVTGHEPGDVHFEIRFLKTWMELREEAAEVPDLGHALECILADDPLSFESAFGRLEIVRKKVADYAYHQIEPRCLCRSLKDFAWFLSDEPSSKTEGRWLKHCGNTGNPREGDRLVSLREYVMEKGVLCWRPILTGVLDSRGWLVELKGAGNSKPKWEYHYLIAWLLAQPEVKGVGTGLRSLPEMDFRWWDLHDDLRWWVLDRRPGLHGLNRRYEEVALVDCQFKRPSPPPPPLGWRDYLEVLFEGLKNAAFVFGFLAVFSLLVFAPVEIVKRLFGH